MKPRERVLAAVQGEEIYPIPIDVFENGIHPKLENGIRNHLELFTDDNEDLLQALGAEIRWGAPPYVGPPLEEADFEGEVSYPFRKIYRNIWGTWEGLETYSDTLERPLSNAETVQEIEKFPWPSADWFDYNRVSYFTYPDGLSYSIKEWAERNNDYARLIGGWNPVFSRIMDMFGFEKGLLNCAASPALIEASIAKIGDFCEEYYKRLAESARGYADFLWFGDDFAGQDGMLINPKSWRKYFLPLWTRLFSIAHENGMKPFMHMCGGVRPVLGDLIDIGLEVYETVQITAKGMDPVELKQEFGQDLTFYGAMNTQQTLPYGTEDDVRDEVRRRVDVFGSGGHYILTSMHFLMDDVPPGNVLAMFDEARSYMP